MRTLITQLVVGILVFGAGAVGAAQRPTRAGQEPLTLRNPHALVAGQGHAMLTLSPMFLEIRAVFEASAELEHELQAKLATVSDSDEAVRLAQRLQRLDTDRQLDVLRIELRYAQSTARYHEIFRLRQEILELMRQDVAALM